MHNQNDTRIQTGGGLFGSLVQKNNNWKTLNLTFIHRLVLNNRRHDELIKTMLKGVYFGLGKKKKKKSPAYCRSTVGGIKKKSARTVQYFRKNGSLKIDLATDRRSAHTSTAHHFCVLFYGMCRLWFHDCS